MQWGVVVTENAPGSSSGSAAAARLATFSLHHLLHPSSCSTANPSLLPLLAALFTLLLMQWGVVVTDNAPGSSSAAAAARSATFSFHQLLHGGETSLAAEYSLPISPPGA
jgi:hypothetical protein